MIVEWLIGIVMGVLRPLLASIPDIPVPGWLDASGPVGQLIGGTAAMSAWMPWPLLVTVGSACVAMWLIGFGIKLVRIVLSFLTLGGGSAA